MARLTCIMFCILVVSSCTRKVADTTSSFAKEIVVPFEQDDNYSASYPEVVDYYESIAFDQSHIQANRVGQTDSGHPLHEVVISADGDFNPSSIRAKGKAVMMINNAIHAGEPCGIDATMMLVRDIAEHKLDALLENVVIVIIPVYNIGGALNRGSHSRANQQGPRLYGFRGNAQNLDLNRDFIKSDSGNALAFAKIFNRWSPDVFVDNHTSNGADYQYVMTLIATQKDKLAPALAEVMQEDMLPYLYKEMKRKEYEMTPYVYVRNTPDDGIAGFLDLPRYSSGYAAMHNAISFMPETHMLKPFKDRVIGTYHFNRSMLQYLSSNYQKVLSAKERAFADQSKQKNFDLSWTIDREQEEKITFKGYKAMYKPSAVSGEDRLYYDHDQPFEKEVPFFNTYKSTVSATKPKAYIVPQAYQEVIKRLKANQVEMTRLSADEVMNLEMYYITDYQTGRSPYEKHYLHRGVEVDPVRRDHQYHAGDYVISTDQPKVRFIVETLEPQGADSYFAWNFFDAILGQKEHFSSYVFEDTAARMLEEDTELRKEFEAKKEADEKFAKSDWAQLNWLYKKSPHYEPTYNLYPVGRVID